MAPLFTYIIIALLAVLLSVLSSIAGLGGGIFLIPLMIFLFDLPVKYVAGTMLLAMVPFTAMATLQNIRNGYVNFRIGSLVQIGAVIGVLVGVHYSTVFSDIILKITFLSIILYLLISLQFKNRSQFNLATQLFRLLNNIPPHTELRKLDIRISLTALIILGFLAGFFSGLLGIGGGFMMVPLFMIGIKLPPKIAVGTSLFMILLTSSIGAIQHAALHHIRYELALALAIGMIIGALIGSLLLTKISERRLTKIISFVLLIAAVGVIFR